MDRAEATGLGVALAGHGVLLAVLSLGLASATTKKPPLSQPLEVSFVEDAALESSAPTPSDQAPAPRLAEVEGPVEPISPPPPAIDPAPAPAPEPPAPSPPAAAPTPVPRPQPAKPVPQATAPRQQPLKPVPQPAKPKPQVRAERPQPPKASPAQPKAAPQRPPAQIAAAQKPAPQKLGASKAPAAQPSQANAKAVARPTGRLSGLLAGISDRETESRSTARPAKVASAAVQASLGAEIRRQLKPHWKAPTGADVELLRTQVTVTLAPNGAVASIGDVRTSGETPSNRSQVKLHQEQAVRAVRLAAPFKLPSDFYDAWKVIRPTFDRRLSQ